MAPIFNKADKKHANKKQDIGFLGESIAREYLCHHHHTILTKNFRTPFGEIDIISQEDDMLCFTEVKASCSDHFGYPEEKVTKKKIDKIYKSAMCFVKNAGLTDMVCRIDVISVSFRNYPENYRVDHFKNITL